MRRRLATMVVEELGRQGIEARLDPDDLDPAQGHWRTSLYADVQAWDGTVRLREGSAWMPVEIWSWRTMSECLRGFRIVRERPGGLELRVVPSSPTGSRSPGRGPRKPA